LLGVLGVFGGGFEGDVLFLLRNCRQADRQAQRHGRKGEHAVTIHEFLAGEIDVRKWACAEQGAKRVH
jgi:hypothetical protein